jgi:tRNA A-37 threonylcarbamoyl transferase component Bud32
MAGLNWKSAHRSEVIHPYIEGTGYALERHKWGKIFTPLRVFRGGVFFFLPGTEVAFSSNVQAVGTNTEIISGTSGRYRVGDSIGRGGLGEVFRAEDTQLHRQVAIKRMHSEDIEAGERAEKVIQEARHLAALQHPNIVTVYDVIEDRGDVLVVMELLRGRTLQEIVESAPLLELDFVNVMRQTLEGLIAAHSLEMLHRDIKPGNLMLVDLPSGAFQVKILDFGLAKIAVEPSLQTLDQTGALMGSVYTMSPEQFEGRPLDARSDLYSLGCVAYFALTGYYPFNGKNVPEVICAHLQRRMAPLKELRTDIAPALCEWVGRMMATYPDNRPASAAQALEELNALANGSRPVPAPARPAPVPQSTAPTPKPWAGIGVAVAVLVLCGLYFQQFLKPAAGTPPAAAATGPTVAVTDTAALLAQEGKRVVVEGEIERTGVNKAGTVRYLNFLGTRRGDLTLVFFTERASQEFTEERLSGFVGKTIRVNGTVRVYEGTPQIEIDSFSQIEML